MSERDETIRRTILLVDDDPIIRGLMSRMLEREGYELLQAWNGRAAMEIARAYTKPIHLLISDVVMPHMSGFDLAKKLSEGHWETKVLLLSGYADVSVAVRGGLKEAGYAFLLKPFTHKELARAVRYLLHGVAKS